MKCKKVNKNLIFYIDGDLSLKQNKEIEEHLSHCKKCSMLYNEIKLSLSVIENEKGIETNPYLYTRIKQRLEDINERSTNPVFAIQQKKLFQPVLVSFLIALGIFIGVSIGNNYPLQENNIADTPSEQYYINDLQQEHVEYFLLNNE
ncbi:MAG: zf-HC2 domain-containing protein [Bacteroidales bacterium]|nr:zf-HC2 domain-containing protein [Bacteroidales bacterium]